MTLRWAPDTWVHKVSPTVNLWRAQVQRPAYFPLSPVRTPHCRLHARQPFSPQVGYLSWKHVQIKKSRSLKGWLCRASLLRQRLALHNNTYRLSSSTSGWSALSQHMSRIRSTLDSVSKAVSGTHSEIISKIARLKPNAVKAGPAVENSPEVVPEAQGSQVSSGIPEAASDPAGEAVGAGATLPSASAASPHPTPAATPVNVIPTSAPTSNVGPAGAAGPGGGEVREKRVRRVPTKVKATEVAKAAQTKPPENAPKSTTVSKQPVALFHPSSFSVNLDETYNYLAHHVNAYFGSSTKADEKKADREHGGAKSHPSNQPSDLMPVSEAPVPSVPTPPKKGIGHYLSYSAPTVQAFVGNYIAPLVPKFRSETKTAALEKEKLMPAEVAAKQEEVLVNKEQMASEEKAKRLLLQREKIIARVSIDNRTRALVQALHRASDVRIYINRVEDLNYHLLEFPETRGVAVKAKAVQCLLRLRQASDPALKAAVSQALTLVGYTNPVNGRGIRILSIDGGGTRGLIALQALHKLEALTGKPIYQLFDYICGVSTGAILGFMLGVFQIPLNECDDLYRKLGSDVFKQNVFVGTMKMGWNHAFYDSETWENILKEKMGSDLLVETSRNPNCPKVAAVSTIVNRGSLKAFVFRNYNLQPGVRSHYLGGCQHKLWQAIRASSAAPGYFQEFPLGNDLHQDGGLLVNNPTALAIHECKCLWPNTPVQCVVSLGTGRHETAGRNNATSTSLKTKISNVISSATDTEEVHTMLDALLPPNTYYRFNPYMNEEIALDERRHEKFNLLQAEAMRYLERNEEKLRKAARVLTQEKSPPQRLADWLKLKADMYDGMPSFSASKL